MAGRITDELGDPLERASVAAMRVGSPERARARDRGSGVTNDAGNFSIRSCSPATTTSSPRSGPKGSAPSRTQTSGSSRPLIRQMRTSPARGACRSVTDRTRYASTSRCCRRGGEHFRTGDHGRRARRRERHAGAAVGGQRPRLGCCQRHALGYRRKLSAAAGDYRALRAARAAERQAERGRHPSAPDDRRRRHRLDDSHDGGGQHHGQGRAARTCAAGLRHRSRLRRDPDQRDARVRYRLRRAREGRLDVRLGLPARKPHHPTRHRFPPGGTSKR